MTSTPIVENEIRDLHEFLAGWLSGQIPQSEREFQIRFMDRLENHFFNIQPSGSLLSLETLSTQIREGYGKSPDFRIMVRDISVHVEDSAYILATYKEFQLGAKNSAPQNARISSVLFQVTSANILKWRHVHETWLPSDSLRANDFSFGG